MTCLTVTPASAAEAIEEKAGLIVSHHPVLFREVKKIRADLPETGPLWKLARAGVAIASPHTAFDNTHDGINDILCRRLGLVDVAPLRPLATNPGEKGAAPGRSRSSSLRPRPTAKRCRPPRSRPARADRRVRGVFVRDPRRGDVLRHRASQPGRRRAWTPRDRRRAAPGIRLPGTTARRRPRVDPARHSYEEPAIDVYPLHETRVEAGRHGRAPAGSGIYGQPAAWRNSRRRRPGARARARGHGRRPHRPIRRVAVPAVRATISSRTPPAPGPTCS